MYCEQEDHGIFSQFLLQPEYKSFINDLQKSIVKVYRYDMVKNIYPSMRRMITDQCATSTKNVITPLRHIMEKQLSQKSSEDQPCCAQPADVGVSRKRNNLNAASTDGALHTKRCKTTQKMMTTQPCIIGFTPLPKIDHENTHKFLQKCGCEKCFKALRSHKYITMCNAVCKCGCLHCTNFHKYLLQQTLE